jgi:septum formation protein
VQPSELDESPLLGELPSDTVKRVALEKARTVADSVPKAIILAADTIVVWKDRILAKPQDREQAYWMLRSLRGRPHEVITAITLLNVTENRVYSSAENTRVWMRHYSEQEMADYIASGDPFDKAGGYAIQNAEMHPVERIEGCYFNVVGLPLCEVVKGLKEVGFPPNMLPKGGMSAVCPHDVIDVKFDS